MSTYTAPMKDMQFVLHELAGLDAIARLPGYGDVSTELVDVERAARESPAGGTIAHGYLTLALLAPTGMEILVPRVRAKQILNYGLDKVRFLAPVLAGKRVRNRIKLAAAEDKGGGRWLLSLENTVEIEGSDKPALVATTLAMVFG